MTFLYKTLGSIVTTILDILPELRLFDVWLMVRVPLGCWQVL